MSAQEASKTPAEQPEKPRSKLPWIVLAVWFVWLGALIVLSWPYWTVSKKNLMEVREERGVGEGNK